MKVRCLTNYYKLLVKGEIYEATKTDDYRELIINDLPYVKDDFEILEEENMKEDRQTPPVCDDTAKNHPTMDYQQECSRLYEEIADKDVIIKALIELVKGRE